MSGFRTSPEYDENIMAYIEAYTREIGVPPTLEQIIENVGEIKSKSALSAHLKKLKADGLLVQKNKKGYYYPTSLDKEEVMIPKELLVKACETLMKDKSNTVLVRKISRYI